MEAKRQGTTTEMNMVRETTNTKEWAVSKQPSMESLKLEDFKKPSISIKPDLLLAKIGSKVAKHLD